MRPLRAGGSLAPRKGRSVSASPASSRNAATQGLQVFVYYNLHRQCLSVRSEQGVSRGKVLAHLDAVELADVNFVVSESGRQRVLAEKAKNVHAGVRGRLVGTLAFDSDAASRLVWVRKADAVQGREVTYNPYLYDTFVQRGTEEAVHRGKRAMIVGKRIVASD